jgi:hypothetical protein
MLDFSGFQTRNVLLPPPVATKFPSGDQAKLRTRLEDGTEERGGGVSGYEVIFCRAMNRDIIALLGAWNLCEVETGILIVVEEILA